MESFHRGKAEGVEFFYGVCIDEREALVDENGKVVKRNFKGGECRHILPTGRLFLDRQPASREYRVGQAKRPSRGRSRQFITQYFTAKLSWAEQFTYDGCHPRHLFDDVNDARLSNKLIDLPQLSRGFRRREIRARIETLSVLEPDALRARAVPA